MIPVCYHIDMTRKEREYGFLLRLTAEEKKDLVKYAEDNDLSQAQAVRKAIKLLFKRK